MGNAPLRFYDFAEHCMVMFAVEHRRWTAEEVRALPDVPGKRFECVDGELLVSPGPRFRHQFAISLLLRSLADHCDTHNIGAVLMGPGELELDEFTLVQPDIFVLPLVDGKLPMSQVETGNALLMVEVLSPGTTRHDRIVKRPRYQREGVEMWIVDLDSRLVERWTPGGDKPEILFKELVWQPPNVSASLTVDLTRLFARALGEI